MSILSYTLRAILSAEVRDLDEIIIRVVPLPEHINAATIPDGEGDYNVYLSSRISEARRRRALLHELEHIERRHFQSDRSVAEKEREIST